jgi:hypothetical protein
MRSVAEKLGYTVEALRRWVRQAERDGGRRAGLTTDKRQRLNELERENRELKRTNEILRLASAFLPRRSSTADRDNGRLDRPAPRHVWGRADQRDVADRPVDVLLPHSRSLNLRVDGSIPSRLANVSNTSPVAQAPVVGSSCS